MRNTRLIFSATLVLAAAASPFLARGHEGDGSGRWSTLPVIGTGPVQEHAVAATSDDLYVIGGIENNVTTSRRDVSAYNFKTSTWRSVAPIPLGLNHPNAVAVDGKIYVLGGLTGPDGEPVWRYTTACFVYDPDTDEWTTLPSMPEDQGRGASAVGVHGPIVYLAGGLRLSYLTGDVFQESVDTVTAYNTRTGEWVRLPPLPEPRDHVGGAVINSTLFVVGGRDHGYENTKHTTWAMNLHTAERGWVTKSEMPTARAGIATGVIDRYIVTFGGEGNPADPSGVFPQSEAYDTESDRWAELGSMLVPRHGMAAASVGGAIFIAGGGMIRGGAEPSDVFTSFTFA
ncbi:hypothetical protein F5X98DRAFT_389782 [Xylaria grammica]|nr:hypothetical protein F5X98DRAFT_389782 [Xylaria grammica]